MEHSEAVLSSQEHLSSNTAPTHSEFSDAPQRDQTPAVITHDLQETPADSLLKLVETSPASVSSPQTLHEELEERRQGFHPGPSVVSDTSSSHIKNIHLPPNLYFPRPVQKHNPAAPLNITPVTLFADVNPSFLVHPHAMPGFNPSWPVLVPRLSASVLGSAFCPVYTPPLSFSLPCKASFRAGVACEDPSGSSPVFGPSLKVFSALQPVRTHADGSPPDSFRLWQRLCETARLFCSGGSDAEALACFFM